MPTSRLASLISIVIPCYNPCDGWSDGIVKHVSLLKEHLPGYHFQIIISNDGSTRINPQEINALEHCPQVVFLNHLVNEGKGAAIRKGMLHATGAIVIYTDIDFPFGIEPIVEIVHLFERHPECSFIYGKRIAFYFQQLPFKRRVISKTMRLVNQFIIPSCITDTQAGIKGLRGELVTEILQTKTNTFVFEIELIQRLSRRQVGIRSVDVSPKTDIVFSNFSSKTLLRESLNLLKIVFYNIIWTIAP